MSTQRLFLDLEGTVIVSWDDQRLINLDTTRALIAHQCVDELHIFSAAIWNEADKRSFERELKPRLEDALDMPILSWVSMEEVWKNTPWATVKFDSVCELVSVIGKRLMYYEWCKATQKTDCLLLDDSFQTESLVTSQQTIAILNIDEWRTAYEQVHGNLQ